MLTVLVIAGQLLVAQSATSANVFWQALEKHKRSIEHLVRQPQLEPSASPPVRNLLAGKIKPLLHKYHRGLTYEFGGLGTDIVELVISAAGIRKNIPGVKRLVRAAPDWDHWKIRAFRPRRSIISGQLHFESDTFDTDRIWYRQSKRGGKVDVELYFEHAENLNRKRLTGPAFIVLDWCIGEYAVMTRIGQVRSEQIIDGWRPKDAKPITRFTAEFDKLTGSNARRPGIFSQEAE